MKRYRFWFDDENLGIGIGTTASEAFKFFKALGFMEEEVVKLDTETIIDN